VRKWFGTSVQEMVEGRKELELSVRKSAQVLEHELKQTLVSWSVRFKSHFSTKPTVKPTVKPTADPTRRKPSIPPTARPPTKTQKLHKRPKQQQQPQQAEKQMPLPLYASAESFSAFHPEGKGV
jgi:hypothetical protein